MGLCPTSGYEKLCDWIIVSTARISRGRYRSGCVEAEREYDPERVFVQLNAKAFPAGRHKGEGVRNKVFARSTDPRRKGTQ